MDKEEFFNCYRENNAVLPGDTWFLVSCTWFENWAGFVGFTNKDTHPDIPLPPAQEHTEQRPGPISNQDIVDPLSKAAVADPDYATSDVILKPALSENVHFVLLPEKAFQYLENEFGCTVSISRKPIEVNESMYKVEVVLKQVRYTLPVDSFVVQRMQLSHKESILNFKNKVAQLAKIEANVKVWKVNLTSISISRLGELALADKPVYIQGAALIDESVSLDDAEIGPDDLILFEPARDGQFYYSNNEALALDKCSFCQRKTNLRSNCRRCDDAKYCSPECRNKHIPEHKYRCSNLKKRRLFMCFCALDDEQSDEEDDRVHRPSVVVPGKSRLGVTGLQNLGNTCFMNSALQCLSHTHELTEHFLSNAYISYLNKSNPLGSKGRLALSYADLLSVLWTGEDKSTAPWKLKKVLGQVAPQFVGYQQHDAHDLLCYLLDGLHEDLNKVVNKPYYADSDFKDMNEQEIANVSWDRHLSRNSSVVVDMFHGQYKSTIHCPTCDNYSYTYDPFDMLNLPITVSLDTKVAVYFIYADGSRTPENLLIRGNYAVLGDLRSVIREVTGVETFQFALVSTNIIRELPEDHKSLSVFGTKFAFEAPANAEQMVQVEVQILKETTSRRNIAYSRLLFLPAEASFKDLHLEVFQKMVSFIEDSIGNSEAECVEHLAAPLYKLCFPSSKFKPCAFCSLASCLGCPVPYSDQGLAQYAKQMLTLELRWKNVPGRVKFDDMNKCLENSKANAEPKAVDLLDCFRFFSQPEQLDKDNAWYCSRCKDHIEATKKFEIYKLPKYLIIHLKRFKTLRYYREKLNTPVSYPVEGLNLDEFVIGPEKPGPYDLYAVSNHFGGLGGGHYTATCYNVSRGAWLDFNDSTVVPASKLPDSAAYILFYKRREAGDLHYS